MYLVKKLSLANDLVYRTSSDRMFLYANSRCIRDKDIEKVDLQ